MATGNVVPRVRDPDANARAAHKYRRKLKKLCPHPGCDADIDDDATTCKEHVDWYKNELAGARADLAWRTAQWAKMEAAGLSLSEISYIARTWEHKRAKGRSNEQIAAEIDQMIVKRKISEWWKATTPTE